MYCPICQQEHQRLLHHFDLELDAPILEKLKGELPHWQPIQGACTRCVDQAQLESWAGPKFTSAYTSKDGYKILPIAQRLQLSSEYTGKGVTICFIDSGFYPHPDIRDRILCMEDLSSDNPHSPLLPDTNSWHGTMTSVVGAGNGSLSNGRYQGLAPAAKLVLLKVADEQGKISGQNIAKAIHWAIENQKRYKIRILNLSVTDDWATSYRINAVDQAIQKAQRAGMVVVVAAGNDENALLKAPANSPHAITVGGLDDHNTLHPSDNSWYPSTYGTTVDGFQKPDLIAPAIWIPAPVLPGTAAHEQAMVLFELANTPDPQYLKAKYSNFAAKHGLSTHLLQQQIEQIRETIATEISQRKLITPHYQHADGTSFAAPIVSGLIAQMLEANPLLNPTKVKEILCRTARKLPLVSDERQGAGVVHPANALKNLRRTASPNASIYFF
ncbi:MAG: S8 family serine peptidase [Haliscomenobacter sp.]|uniref:S8 family serine peptidase n=1 Tax=Haliscomenobacter sp. TaxID=2717303 RepID=UPI0029A2AD8B|nr:S8 family serine peptidase [Haliscomenobacter sp.]MDX2071236.1 S8 family serine peptidase [Haliscomenobacter sp.]